MSADRHSGKVSDEDKTIYQNMAKECQEKIDKVIARENDYLLLIKETPEEAALTHMTLAEEMLNLALFYIEIDGFSKEILGIKNEKALDDARKSVIKCLSYLKSIVTDIVDAPFSDYGENLVKIASYDAGHRYRLIEKTGETIELLKEAFGDNNRWKWSFVELEGLYAAVAKNILDLKNIVTDTDPRSPHYEPTVRHLKRVKELLTRAANRYREKYEMSTNDINDFKKGLHFLNSLFRIHVLIGEKDEAAVIKKKRDVWVSKLEADIKSKKSGTQKK